MKKSLLILTAVVLLFSAKAQETETENPYFKKHSVTMDFAHVAGVLNFNYEHYWKYKFFGANEIGFKAGYTNACWMADINENSYGAFLFGYNHVFTKNHKHALVVNIDMTPFTPNVLLGLGSSWRYQSKKGFTSKLGLGFSNGSFPLTFIGSIGWSF